MEIRTSGKKIEATTKQLAARLNVDYQVANQFVKLLSDKGHAKCVKTIPSLTGKGRGSKVYNLSSVITFDLSEAA